MLFLRPVLLFCACAVSLALLLGGSLFAVALITGWSGFFAKPSGWVLTFSTLWAAALVMGLLLAKHIHLFPFLGPR
jgi:hypothetical protein